MWRYVALLVVGWAMGSVVAAEPLLKNGALALPPGGGPPAGWFLAPAGTTLAADTANLPEGLSTSVRIKVAAGGEGDGQLVQALPLQGKGWQHLRLSGWLRSQANGCGYLQVKLYAQKKEIARQLVARGKERWERVETPLAVAGADRLEIVCRWRPEARFQGTDVWFAGLELVPVRVTLALAGDLTVQNYAAAAGAVGWGQALPGFLTADAAVMNAAQGTCSAKTFRTDGHWEKLLAARPGYLLIQFGHNDSHEPGRPESTSAAGEFPECLRQYVREARQAGSVPILVTPPHRRSFGADGKLTAELAPYAEATRQVAAELKVPLIDLYAVSEEALQRLGDEGSQPLFASAKDGNRLSLQGARLLAEAVAAGLRREVPDLAAAGPDGKP